MYPDVAVPGSRLHLADVDVVRTLTQLRAFEVVDTVTLPTSGVTAVIHSDKEIAADAAAIDEVMHARLHLVDEHENPLLRARIQCYADTIVSERAFAGSVVNIYVPSDPATCLRDFQLVTRSPGSPWLDACDWSGATPPVHLEGLLGEVRLTEYHVLLAPGVTPWDDGRPHPRVAEVLRHESDHLWDWVMGQRIEVLPNERRAQHGDDLVRKHYRSRGDVLPNPFQFG